MKSILCALLLSAAVAFSAFGQSSVVVQNAASNPVKSSSVTVTFNQLFDIDVTAAGIAAGDVLAPVVTFAGVNRTSGSGVQLQQITIFNRNDSSLSFTLLVTKQALSSWGLTNAVAYVPDVDDTNVVDVISSADGTWTDLGTNRFWEYHSAGRYYFPLTTNLFLYSINTAAITNTKPARISAKFFRD